MRVITVAAAMAVLGLSAGAAAAQDYNLAPNFGSVRLNAGFTPDPYNVSVQSGGTINAANAIGGSCRGYISNAPDFEISYSAGSLPLIISANSSADTTLVVNGPDGRWYCDDDGGQQGLNPSLNFGRPQSGLYHVWIGTYGNSSLQPATLSVSELYSQ